MAQVPITAWLDQEIVIVQIINNRWKKRFNGIRLSAVWMQWAGMTKHSNPDTLHLVGAVAASWALCKDRQGAAS